MEVNIEDDKYIMNCDCGKEHTFEIDFSLYKSRKQFGSKYCTICYPPYKYNISQAESVLFDFIKENYDREIITNKKDIIPSYELDIYLPELKIAFEFNGVYWHNELNKSDKYHKMKSDMCDTQGIQLIHIWEDDWVNKQEIVKSIILNKIKQSSNKIYARKCEIKEIDDNKLVKQFLLDNHIQGFVGAGIKIGLFYENELVSLMTYGMKRKMMNSSSANVGDFEMLRFCNKLNTNVIGGASKIFNYFIKKYNPSEITTYADRSFSKGDLYTQLGFKFIHITEPNYYYVINGIRKHRFGFRKDVLIKEGYDGAKTEHQIMLDRKIYRIFNAGNYKFIYENK